MASRQRNVFQSLLLSAETRVLAAKIRHEEAVHKKRIAETRLASLRCCGFGLAAEIAALEAEIKEKAPQAVAQGESRRDIRLAAVVNFRQVSGRISPVFFVALLDLFNIFDLGLM